MARCLSILCLSGLALANINEFQHGPLTRRQDPPGYTPPASTTTTTATLSTITPVACAFWSTATLSHLTLLALSTTLSSVALYVTLVHCYFLAKGRTIRTHLGPTCMTVVKKRPMAIWTVSRYAKQVQTARRSSSSLEVPTVRAPVQVTAT